MITSDKQIIMSVKRCEEHVFHSIICIFHTCFIHIMVCSVAVICQFIDIERCLLRLLMLQLRKQVAEQQFHASSNYDLTDAMRSVMADACVCVFAAHRDDLRTQYNLSALTRSNNEVAERRGVHRQQGNTRQYYILTIAPSS